MNIIYTFFSSVLCLFIYLPLSAQFSYTYGTDIGIGVNAIGVGYQDLTSIGLATNFANKGKAETSNPLLFAGGFISYSSPTIGFRFRTSYDNRSGIIQDEFTANSRQMMPSLAYITNDISCHYSVLPTLSFYIGPSISFLIHNKINRIDANDNDNPIPAMNSICPGFLGGIMYKTPLSFSAGSFSSELSTFLESSWMVNQRKGEFSVNNSGLANIWSTVSIRAGISLHFQFNKNPIDKDYPATDSLSFYVKTPKEIAGKRRIVENFPLLPVIYFRPNNSNIPFYYQQLSSEQAASFSESQLDEIITDSDKQKHASKRIMVYQHILNIIGSRMTHSKDTLFITGIAPEEKDGIIIAGYIKDYLTGIFRIDGGRIKQLEDNNQKNIKNYDSDDSVDIVFKRQDSRRIVLKSNSPALLKPVQLHFESVDPPENEIEIRVYSPSDLTSWTMQLLGPDELMKNIGPFSIQKTFINATSLLNGALASGKFTALVQAEKSTGIQLQADTSFALTMSNAAKMSAERFTVLQEGYESTEHFIEEIVSVVQSKLNNHTEIVLIGSSGANGDNKENENKVQKLLERIKSQIEQSVAKKGKPITIKLLNYGEDPNRVSFTQELPYGRSYNDCITIEMIK